VACALLQLGARDRAGVGSSDRYCTGADVQPTSAPEFVRVVASEAPPRYCVGPNGPIEKLKSWQTVGSTTRALVGAALAVVAGTATASAAATAVRAARGFRRDNIL
jgi:hypothetical protein